MTAPIIRPLPNDAGNWRKLADQAASVLKASAVAKPVVKIGFMFGKETLVAEVTSVAINRLTQRELSDHIFKLTLAIAGRQGSA